MSFLMSYGPIVLSSLGGALALFGDCTRRGEGNQFKGLLPRGWVSLGVIVIALFISIFKQLNEENAEAQRMAEINRQGEIGDKTLEVAHDTNEGIKEVHADMRGRLETVSVTVEGVSTEVVEMRKELIRLGTLVGFAQAKEELVVRPGDALGDEKLIHEVRGERVYDMNLVLAEIKRLEAATGVTVDFSDK